jgi:hypothetical protein
MEANFGFMMFEGWMKENAFVARRSGVRGKTPVVRVGRRQRSCKIERFGAVRAGDMDARILVMAPMDVRRNKGSDHAI